MASRHFIARKTSPTTTPALRVARGASYITGSHSVKIGYQGAYLTDDRTWFTNDQNLTSTEQRRAESAHAIDLALGEQRARGVDGVLLAGAVDDRSVHAAGGDPLDRVGSSFPNSRSGRRFLPTAIVFPETKGVDSYKDFTPRLGMAWDVFGTGRTAIKVSVGKYLEGVGTAGTTRLRTRRAACQ